ncbi:MAG: hypothetical protein ACI4TT_02620 [Christensenellales bacterium]
MFNCCRNWRENNMRNNCGDFDDRRDNRHCRDNDDCWNSNKWFDECWENNCNNRRRNIIVCHCERFFDHGRDDCHGRDDNFDCNRNNRCRRRRCNFCNLFRF